MKTIWDAVNELQGEWKFRSDFICTATGSSLAYDKDDIYQSGSINVNSWLYHIYTKEEFNALVTEMSLGLDVNPINDGYYHKYLAADKQELEPAPVIDWDSAPEGATHYWEKSQSFYKFSSFEEDFVFCTGGWELCSDIACFGTEGLIPRPVTKPVDEKPDKISCEVCFLANHPSQEYCSGCGHDIYETKPVYTQEMCDNGELPPIGSMFIDIELNNEEQVEAMAHDLPLGRVIYKRGSTLQDSEYFGAQAHECKPIPPKLELIDGEAYQFDIDSLVVNGIYRKMDNKFYNYNGDFGVEYCNNIKPLTVSD